MYSNSSSKITRLETNLVLHIDADLHGKFVFNTNDIIGNGAFGEVFKGINMYTFDEVAIKTSPIGNLELIYEEHAYDILGAKNINHNIQGLPVIYYMGNIGFLCTTMVMELLGPSLDKLFERCGKVFSLKTTLAIADQMISRIEYVHKCGYIHRDIKPENVCIGRPRQSFPNKKSTENVIYLLDYGLSKSYIDPNTNEHIPSVGDVGIFGTYEFMSINSHSKTELSRRDDLESIGYVLLYLVNGTLPWMQFINEDLDSFFKICQQMKVELSSKSLCQGLPDEFVEYFNYVKKLDFAETPDYEWIRSIFYEAADQHTLPDQHVFDWFDE